MKRVAIIKTGTTYPALQSRFGDFEDWFIRGLSPELDLTVIDVTAGESPGAATDWQGIVVTGSPAMVTDRAEWSESSARWLATAVAAEIPVLGVCYGHQLLAHALGGTVGYHPQGRETGSWPLTLKPAAASDPLFGRLPPRFVAQLTHLQSVLTLPEGAVLLASSEFEPHQAFRFGNTAWGVQFHPEFTAEIMRAYLQVQTPALREEKFCPDALMAGVQDAPEASSLLQRFSELVLGIRPS
ncbi:glutamine amidotransferase [Marinobacter sp. X15-166B]|uniref:glutamine amidotransferase n=1 Tax=Marinobacter sp. X15-166B TaxID=1897620 RepID=UPI00085C155F|nr:glutamine amidotransferase [Marinobacter sp. X15-166B]OEY66941.1 GMP synthase [Marinobacter sp. X15-166B]